MESLNRRGFIKKSMLASAGLTVGAPAYIKGFAKNKPSDVINVAVVGIRSRGGYYYGGSGHTANFTKIKNSRVVAICDIDENLFPQAIADIEKLRGEKPRTVVDFRDLLDDKEIDAVSIATPDHWHALQTIWACQAGKDVYMEKPISYTIDEGRKMVQAARKYNRIVQTGTQSRSKRLVQKAIQLIHDGVIGDVYMGRGVVFGHRANIGRLKDSPIPEGVHWDLFLGPAPYRPFNKNRFHYNWHWYWDTATSEFGNNGIHVMDEVRWGMRKRVHPKKIHCCGGFYVWDSDQEIPNLQIGTFEFEDGKIMELEVRSLFTNYEEGEKGGCFFYGSKGWMHLGSNSFEVYLGKTNEKGPSMKQSDFELNEFDKAEIDPHFVNFLDCMRSRRWQDLNADILEGHRSTAMMLMGNIAYRTGRKLTFNGNAEKFINDDDANTYLTRQYRHPYVLPDEV
ncbi:MAG: Gfo/Idh/MocA family oxidoreductase [Bacteroidales bacterium]|nr:Gfo/Idh/MocA family oxidoreductase [Bacteroidales bacterium]